jgi:hypothetical protein
MKAFASSQVAAVFSGYPRGIRMYFHCQTDLIHRFLTLFPQTFAFEGNRAIVFREGDEVPVRELEICIAAALTYRRTPKIGSAARKNG